MVISKRNSELLHMVDTPFFSTNYFYYKNGKNETCSSLDFEIPDITEIYFAYELHDVLNYLLVNHNIYFEPIWYYPIFNNKVMWKVRISEVTRENKVWDVGSMDVACDTKDEALDYALELFLEKHYDIFYK